MYHEIIERIKPKPKFNLEFYTGVDQYTDGPVEDIIFNIVSNNEPEDYIEDINKNFNWAVYYHLTQTRKNILNWYPFKEDSTILEIGCGMGAITNMLCEVCKEVTAVELSKKRASTTLLRCRNRENLEIIVGNLNDIVLEKKFDYITLIGVLEYQGNFTKSENSYVDFLKKIKTLLKPEGKLLIGIENQYGLKYWCGAKEDHLGIPFESINNYSHSQRGVRTFSKETLREIIHSAGFEDMFFYYPMPDYKLPTVIYSEKYLPQQGRLSGLKYYYIPNDKTLFADERRIYDELIKNNVFEFFANSYLVECGNVDLGKIVYAKLNTTRNTEYQTGIKISNENKVERFSIDLNKNNQHINNIAIYEKEIKQQDLEILVGEKKKCSLEYAEYKSKKLLEVLSQKYNENKEEEIIKLWDNIYNEILHSSSEVSWEENIIYTFELGIIPEKEKFGQILKKGYIDMIPQNAFYENEKIIWFDQEWMLENIPAKFIMYRALYYFYIGNSFFNKVIKFDDLCIRYNIDICLEEFKVLDQLFVSIVYDENLVKHANYFRGAPENSIFNNLKKLLNKD